MRIAVVGSGIAGLASAWLLSTRHEVTLFEANDYLGGHTHTHDVAQDGQRYAIDTGFIVHNRVHYPLLTRLFEQLGVRSIATTMSFSVRNAATGLEYGTRGLNALFCQRRNLLSPRFHGMLLDLFRFYREAPRLLDAPDATASLGDYLAEHRYGAAFRDEHLLPMACALWSSSATQMLSFPVRYLVQFMANHQMLQLNDRPEWRVVQGGSAAYVHALRARWDVKERLACPVRSVRRNAQGAEVTSAAGIEYFDQVVLACHSNQALELLSDATEQERDILGALRYQVNDAILHTDARVLPRHRRAWAAWNAYMPATPSGACTVSYCMNILQRLTSREPFVVTLNRSADIDPRKILRRVRYEHPVYTATAVAAQARKHEIQGRRRTWFAGAYWGWGFHEDGMRSATEIAAAFSRNYTPAAEACA
jgi:predicted NAD/FAD-binding protein